MTNPKNTQKYGMMNATAQAYSDPCRLPRMVFQSDCRGAAGRPISAIDALVMVASQLAAIGYLAKMSSIRLRAFSAAAFGVMPPMMMSVLATPQVCSLRTAALAGL